jgi:hypothetical protein
MGCCCQARRALTKYLSKGKYFAQHSKETNTNLTRIISLRMWFHINFACLKAKVVSVLRALFIWWRHYKPRRQRRRRNSKSHNPTLLKYKLVLTYIYDRRSSYILHNNMLYRYEKSIWIIIVFLLYRYFVCLAIQYSTSQEFCRSLWIFVVWCS